MCEKDSHLILPDLFLLCRIHPRPTMSDEVFCGKMDKDSELKKRQTAHYTMQFVVFNLKFWFPLSSRKVYSKEYK